MKWVVPTSFCKECWLLQNDSPNKKRAFYKMAWLTRKISLQNASVCWKNAPGMEHASSHFIAEMHTGMDIQYIYIYYIIYIYICVCVIWYDGYINQQLRKITICITLPRSTCLPTSVQWHFASRAHCRVPDELPRGQLIWLGGPLVKSCLISTSGFKVMFIIRVYIVYIY